MLKRLLTRLVQPTPFKAGLVMTVLLFFTHPHFGAYWLPGLVSSFLESVDARLHDLLFHVRGPEPARDYPVVIVDIDEKSMSRLGQWPWPRDVVTRILERIDEAGPGAIGLDIVFAEPDRTSLKQQLPLLQRVTEAPVEVPRSRADLLWLTPDETAALLESILGEGRSVAPGAAASLDNDAVLADFVAGCPRLVLGYFFQLTDDGLREPAFVPYGAGVFYRKDLPGAMEGSPWQAKGAVPYRPVDNIAVLADAAEERCGVFNASIVAAGTVRRVPLIWEYQGNLYPALSLQMLRLGHGDQSGRVIIGNLGAERIETPSFAIPTDKIGRLYVNFRGPARTFDYLSAVDVLEGRVPATRLADKYVLVGTSAGGLLDLRSTPFDEASPGVEVHANVIDNVLRGDMLREPSWGFTLELVLILAVGAGLSALLAYSRPLIGAGLAVLAAVGLGWGAFHLMFAEHLIVNLVHPLLAVVGVTMTVTTFNYFFEGRQKRYIKGAFGTYLSPELVDQLVESPEKLTLKGEEKELTVLFSDIRGFTGISEKLSAEGLAGFLNEYLTPMSDIVMETRGYVDKFIGDAVMAFWGAPVDDPEHARHAAVASLRMLAALQDLQPHWAERGLPRIEIGIGLNSGPMSVGNMGSESRFNYTVMGDNVNLGSRLEGLNKAYGTSVIIAESTRKALGAAFATRLLDKVRVKGKEEPVRIYELLAEGPLPAARRREVDAFEAAFAAYQAQRFGEAEATLQRLQAETPHPLYELYLERLAFFRHQPPGEGWDGVYTFTTK
jgi:adenylate cyclase